MVKPCSFAAAVAVATLAAAAPARAFFFSPFVCGKVAGKPCCVKFSGQRCDEGMVCKSAVCRKCGFEGAPVCDGPKPCGDGFVLERGACVPDVPPDDGCGSLDEVCCIGDAGFSCDRGLACDRNVQELLGPGICRECGAVDEIPCADGTCDKGLESESNEFGLSICVDPKAPPPPPCGSPGEPCCTGVNIPFDASGCDPDNLCAFGDGPSGTCEPCGAAGEQCCVEQNDDILTTTCSAGNVCGDEGSCVPCGALREPCCEGEDYGPPGCDAGFICNSRQMCEFEPIVEGQAPIDPDEVLLEEDAGGEDDEEEEEPVKGDGGRDVDEDIQFESEVAGEKREDEGDPEPEPTPEPEPSPEPEPTPVSECCSDDLPICCSGTCITLEDAAAASCVAGASCCDEPEPEPEAEEDGDAGAGKEPTGNPVDADIQKGVVVVDTRPPDAPPVDTSNQETVRTEESQEIDDGVTRVSRVRITETTV